ncbi:MAG: prolipoprotein diacylglyceryl transferase [Fuerstiella sp.]|jgi:phosphatidylglycerol:prolipoprotein diacylglycerol transferase|nr:prolipoprotein diacylglyceryl transferase [Fuerstiella sp.]MDG2130163.1 prolipoprotein diacylglyceryl transferase [Fuerstiella sp.]
MRKVLLRIVFEQLWYLESVGNELLVGYGWMIAAWLMIAVMSLGVMWWITRDVKQVCSSLFFWAAIPAAIVLIPVTGLPIVQTGIPVFGYGFMLFVGFSTATLLAGRRAKTVGLSPDVIWDLIMWLMIPGIIGARIVYLLQNGDRVFAGRSGPEILKATIALWDGGIVFYGGIIGGVVGLLLFCRRHEIRPLQLGDVIMPSLFLGLGFGRIGCFLYGCCFGGACTLPWAVQFPPDSMTYNVLSHRGPEFLTPDMSATIALHPTQIYSSMLAFLLAGFLMWFFKRRPFEGAVLSLGWILYPINRFSLEIIRDDEPGRMGTSLTFSQLMSIGLFVSGCILMLWLPKKNNPQQLNGTGSPRSDVTS